MKKVILIICALLLFDYSINDKNIFSGIQNDLYRKIIVLTLLLVSVLCVIDIDYYIRMLKRRMFNKEKQEEKFNNIEEEIYDQTDDEASYYSNENIVENFKEKELDDYEDFEEYIENTYNDESKNTKKKVRFHDDEEDVQYITNIYNKQDEDLNIQFNFQV